MSSSKDDAPVRRRVIYRGRVQGVGFRYTVTRIARRFPVAGYVKNLGDGSVELAVEAASKVFEKFHAEIQRAFRDNITGFTVEEMQAGPPFEGFQVRN